MAWETCATRWAVDEDIHTRVTRDRSARARTFIDGSSVQRAWFMRAERARVRTFLIVLARAHARAAFACVCNMLVRTLYNRRRATFNSLACHKSTPALFASSAWQRIGAIAMLDSSLSRSPC